MHGKLPWTKSCFVCGQDNPRGFRLRSRVEDGRVVIEYTTRETDVGYRHLVHGGICMTLMDEVMTWSAILATGKICVAAEMTTRLKAAVSAGQPLRIEGWITKHARRLLLTESRILDADGAVLAEATGKYMPVSTGHAELNREDFVAAEGVITPDEILRTEEEGRKTDR